MLIKLDPIWGCFCISDHNLILDSCGDTHHSSWTNRTNFVTQMRSGTTKRRKTLEVWYLLWVQVVPGSIPGMDLLPCVLGAWYNCHPIPQNWPFCPVFWVRVQSPEWTFLTWVLGAWYSCHTGHHVRSSQRRLWCSPSLSLSRSHCCDERLIKPCTWLRRVVSLG
jgi:hypothetical protein